MGSLDVEFSAALRFGGSAVEKVRAMEELLGMESDFVIFPFLDEDLLDFLRRLGRPEGFPWVGRTEDFEISRGGSERRFPRLERGIRGRGVLLAILEV